MPSRRSAQKKTTKKRAGSKRKNTKRAEFTARQFFFSPFILINWLTRNFSIWIKWPARLGLSCSFLALNFGLIAGAFYHILANTYDLEEVTNMPARTEILDRQGNILKNSAGQEIGFLHGKNRHLVRYDEVSPLFINALIAREDGRFREHGAVDIRGFGRSIFRLVA